MTDQASFEDRLRKQIEAYHEAALVYAAVRLGLPDRLAVARSTPSEHLPRRSGCRPPHLHRFLRGLCSIGICEELPDGAFALAPGGQSLRSGSPSRLAEKVQIVVGQYWWPWANVVVQPQDGQARPSSRSSACASSTGARENAEQGALFDSYLAKETLAQAEPIVAALDLSGTKRSPILAAAMAGCSPPC